MTRKITVQRVIESPPFQAPDGSLVFNAPRPLYGHDWQGDFIHGIFYVSIDPSDHHAPRQIKDNVSYDGWIIQYVSWDEVMEWARGYAKENEFDLEEFDDLTIRQSYFVNCGRVEIGYPEDLSVLFETYGVKHGR